MNDMKTTEEKKVMKNIIFVEKENANYEVDSLFKNSVKTISLDDFIKTIFSYVEKHPNLDVNKIVFVEYENITELTDTVFNKDLEIMKLYLDNIIIVSDSHNHTIKNVKIIKPETLQKHLDYIFDIYNSTTVLSKDIIREIDKEVKSILKEGSNRLEPYVSVENLTYLQELRYYLQTIDYANIGGDHFEPTNIIISYLIEKVANDESSDTIITNIINHSFEFGDGIWSDINDALNYDIEEMTKK